MRDSTPQTHRKAMKRREAVGDARYLTFSCYQRLPLFLNDAVKRVFTDRLSTLHDDGGFAIYAWVIMPEHVHLLVRPDVEWWTVDRLCHSLKRPVAECIMRRWEELRAPILQRLIDGRGRRHFWQPGGGYDRNVFSREELLEKANYIHDNPVRRGLVAEQEMWKWSSAGWYAGKRSGTIVIDELPLR